LFYFSFSGVAQTPFAIAQRNFNVASISQVNMLSAFPAMLLPIQPQKPSQTDLVYEMVNRNKRKLKSANHGARPNNSRGRKARRLRRH